MPLPPENRVDIASALRQATADGPIWSAVSDQFNLNLLRLPTGDAILAHVNSQLDVLIVVFEGAGELLVDGDTHELSAGIAVVIPRGTRRAIRCTAGPLVYLTCHHRVPGLMPS